MLTNREIKNFIDSQSYAQLTYRLNRRYDHGGPAHWLISFSTDQFNFNTLGQLGHLCDAYIRARDILGNSIQVDTAVTYTTAAPSRQTLD